MEFYWKEKTWIFIQNVIILGGARGVTVIVIRSGPATRVQIMDDSVYILHCTNTLGKGRNSTILPPAIGK